MPPSTVPAVEHSDATGALARVTRWEDRTAWPLFLGSLMWFGAVTLVWTDPHPSATVQQVSSTIIGTFWVWFIVDYLIRLV